MTDNELLRPNDLKEGMTAPDFSFKYKNQTLSLSDFKDKKVFLSLEERMGCGIGACFACVCHTGDEQGSTYKKVCSDGPVFRAGEVIL